MPIKTAPLNYSTAVLQVFLSDTARFFSIAEIAEKVTENNPLPPSLFAVRNAVNQLLLVPILEQKTERRHYLRIPVNVYKYKL